MNYDYYRVFYYVGKHKNITKAAEELYTSQPAVTRVIKNLERDLGCTLLIRNKRGVELTPEGQTLFNYASMVEELLQKGESEIVSAISVNTGIIYIATTVTALEECLFACLDEFHSQYPAVKFNLSSQSSDLTIGKLVSGAADVAFVTTPFNRINDLEYHTLFSFKNILISGNGFQELKEGTYSLSDLSNYPFVSLSSKMQLRDYFNELFITEGLKASPEVECDSANLIVPMVSHNLGIGIVPETFATKRIKEGKIFEVQLEKKLPDRDLVLISNPKHPQSKAAKAFKKFILTKYGLR